MQFLAYVQTSLKRTRFYSLKSKGYGEEERLSTQSDVKLCGLKYSDYSRLKKCFGKSNEDPFIHLFIYLTTLRVF